MFKKEKTEPWRLEAQANLDAIEKSMLHFARPRSLRVHWDGTIEAEYWSDFHDRNEYIFAGNLDPDEVAALQPAFDQQIEEFQFEKDKPVNGVLIFNIKDDQPYIYNSQPQAFINGVEQWGWNGKVFLDSGNEAQTSVKIPELPVTTQVQLTIASRNEIEIS